MNLKQFCDHYWYKLRDEIPSWWDRYRNWIPSVTTVLSLIVDPGFEWIKKNNNEQLQNAIIRWKKTHADAESFFNGDIATLHKQILKFHIINSVEIISQEELYEKDISWTIDLVASLMLNWVRVEMNIDYKSSLYLNPKYKFFSIYISYAPWFSYVILNHHIHHFINIICNRLIMKCIISYEKSNYVNIHVISYEYIKYLRS